MAKITPHLWFDKEAKEAAAFYSSVFDNSKIKSTTAIHDTPSGSCDIVVVQLMGQDFHLISAGPLFKFTPAISFLVAFSSADQVNALWEKLFEGGSVLMPLDSYPFSERYGWLADQYGVNWQITVKPDAQGSITPALLFVGDKCGMAEEAVNLYTSVFPNSRIDDIDRYGEGEGDTVGNVKFASFSLEGQPFAVMESGHSGHAFDFNEAVSLMVHCKDQREIDHYWERLSADPKFEQCGWIKDEFGVSWQIVPEAMNTIMADSDEETRARVTQEFLKMKKFDLAKLEEAYQGA